MQPPCLSALVVLSVPLEYYLTAHVSRPLALMQPIVPHEYAEERRPMGRGRRKRGNGRLT